MSLSFPMASYNFDIILVTVKNKYESKVMLSSD